MVRDASLRDAPHHEGLILRSGRSPRLEGWQQTHPSGQDDSGKLGLNMKARVTVTLKPGILDPQGKAIEGALKSLGVDGIASVRQGKVFDIELSGSDTAKAEAALKDAADKLLANTVIENYRVEVLS
jgi:phosphoribosylformylglycinamidine synthase subunit PurS